MINAFDGNFISKIDMEKTTRNGKAVCELYQPLVEKRLKQAKGTQFNSASFVMFSGKYLRLLLIQVSQVDYRTSLIPPLLPIC